MKKRVFYVILGLLAGVFIMAGMTQLTKKQATDTADTPNTVDKQGGLLFHLVPVHVGDGLVFELPTGEVVLIDGGGSDTEVLDHAYCSDVLSYLKERGIKKIDVAIATHQDYDHVLGLWCIGQDPDITINKLYYNNDLRPVIHEEIFNFVTQGTMLKAGDKLAFGDIRFDVLWPDTNDQKALAQRDQNDNSIVIQVVHGDVTILLTGDCVGECEKELLAKYGKKLQSDILKAGHHGFIDSSLTTGFLEQVNPETIVVSPGTIRKQGLSSTLARYKSKTHKSKILRTSTNGLITVISDGKKALIKTKEWEPPSTEDMFLREVLHLLNYNYTYQGEEYNLPKSNPALFGCCFDMFLNPGMVWLEKNTPKNAHIMSWWNEAYSVRALAEREAIVMFPSKETLFFFLHPYTDAAPTQFAKSPCAMCSPPDKFRDVAEALTTTHPKKAVEIMARHNTEYLVATDKNRNIDLWIDFVVRSSLYDVIVDKKNNPHLTFVGTDEQLTEFKKKAMLHRMLRNEIIPGFENVYADFSMHVYKKI